MPHVLNTAKYEASVEHEKATLALRNAKIQESDRLRKGWRYHKVNSRITILVPYEDGEPTKEGVEMIDKYKATHGL